MARLSEVHEKIRTGSFHESLLTDVRTSADEWQNLPNQSDRLKGLYVAVEVLDYFGYYDEAAIRLGRAGHEQVKLLEGSSISQCSEHEVALLKRRVWVALAYATVLYRREEYDHALAALDICSGAIHVTGGDAAISPFNLFGTRARIAHSRGQIFRQLHDYARAREEFSNAIMFARQRFVAKTPYAEQSSLHAPPLTPAEQKRFSPDRLLAEWTIGKCLALGLGWIDLQTGNLSSSRMFLNAGYVLLRGTGDIVHRAYTVVLMGAVERARAGEDQDQLAHAIKLLEDGSRVLRQHPTFRLRASYELALAYYRTSTWRSAAREELDSLKQALGLGATGAGNRAAYKSVGSDRRAKIEPRSARWASTAMAIESRMHRLEGNVAAALSCARHAVAYASQAGEKHTEIQAEAHVVLGEALLAQSDELKTVERSNYDSALSAAARSFQTSLVLAGSNPKIEAVCHLHIARVFRRQELLLEAHLARARAAAVKEPPQHGYIQHLFTIVDRELDTANCFFINAPTMHLDWNKNVGELRKFLALQSRTRPVKGVTKRHQQKILAGLADTGEIPRRRPGRPRKQR